MYPYIRCTFSFSPKKLATIYQPGKLIFTDIGLEAVWLGDILASIRYTDIRAIETTKSIFHWYKIIYGSNDKSLYVQSSSTKRFAELITGKNFSITVVKRLS